MTNIIYSSTLKLRRLRKESQLYYVFLLLFILISLIFPTKVTSQTAQKTSTNVLLPKETPQVAAKVDIKPSVLDSEIRKRLENILKATNWYVDPKVNVKEGVVFLQGKTKKTAYKKWAEELARNTQDVVTVVNQIEVVALYSWDSQQVMIGMQKQWRNILQKFPFYLLSLFILIVTWIISRFTAASTRKSLRYQQVHPLLSDVIARGVALSCFLIGLYIVLQVMGWTTAALTIVGGTGLLGIILGMAFRDITENLLASVLLSVQRPFQNGDLVEIDEITGYVQKLTLRATILMTLDGNHVQIPNATVYKTNIRNFTSNPNRREDFMIGIGYDAAVSNAQEIALKVLADHPAVLKDPEPWVLVDNLTPSRVNLRVYFWLNGSQFHWRKVKSSVIRLTKRAFQTTGITIPGDTMELSFADDVPVQLRSIKSKGRLKVSKISKESDRLATDAEDELRSEAADIKEQARRSRPSDKEKNLLDSKEENEQEK